jgi:hypothetical protein
MNAARAYLQQPPDPTQQIAPAKRRELNHSFAESDV